MKWQKVASVTPGGKPYFFVSEDKQGNKLCVVWNRFQERWAFQFKDVHICYFDTIRQAKYFAQTGMKFNLIK